MKIGRYDGVQVLRLVAAMLVVLTHSFHYAHERMGTSFSWDNGARGVDVFFVISGFVMIVSSQKLMGDPLAWRHFMAQRLLRIVPMYWVATTLKVAVMLTAARLVFHADLDFLKIVSSYFFIPYKKASGRMEPILGVGWTLVFEMFFYVVFAVGLKLRLNVYAFVGSVMAAMSLASLARPADFPVYLFLADPIVLEFFFGMLVARLALSQRFLPVPLAVMLALLSLTQLVFGGGDVLPRTLSVGLPAVVLVYAVISLEGVLQRHIPRVLVFMGAASYSMYLIHPLILPAIPALLPRLGVGNVWVSVALSVPVILVVSALVYKFVERPMDALLQQRFKAPRAAEKLAAQYR